MKHEYDEEMYEMLKDVLRNEDDVADPTILYDFDNKVLRYWNHRHAYYVIDIFKYISTYDVPERILRPTIKGIYKEQVDTVMLLIKHRNTLRAYEKEVYLDLLKTYFN